jgi:hypothetical protein
VGSTIWSEKRVGGRGGLEGSEEGRGLSGESQEWRCVSKWSR